jgi:hypothetical protein
LRKPTELIVIVVTLLAYRCPVQAIVHVGSARTPAMAAGLTDHIWSIFDVLSYKVTSPPWIEPKRRRRPKKRIEHIPMARQQPRIRPLDSASQGKTLCHRLMWLYRYITDTYGMV